MTTTDTIKLKMTGKLAFDDEISITQAAQIIEFLHSGQAPSLGRTPGRSGDLIGSAARIPHASVSSPRDALTSSGAKTNPQKIVAFALYVEQQGDKQTFTLDDVKPLFRQARESTPANLSRDLDTAIRLNWVTESDVKGEYYVKDTVLNVLETGFESLRATRPIGTKPKGTPVRRPRKTPIPEIFQGIEVTPAIDGYINYHRLKTRTERYLWALNAAKLWGVEALTNQELVWLTDKLGVGISAGDVAANYRSNYNHGYVNKNAEGKARVLPAGTEHLRSLAAGSVE